MPHASRVEQTDASARRAAVLTRFPTDRFTLRSNVRALRDPDFAAVLLAVGDGSVEAAPAVSPCSVVLPARLRAGTQTALSLVEWVYEGLDEVVCRVMVAVRLDRLAPRDVYFIAQRGVLAPRNDQIVEVNSEMQGRLRFGDARRYVSSNRLKDKASSAHGEDGSSADTDFSAEALQSIDVPGLPPHEL